MGVIRTPWRLLDLFLTRIHRLLKPLDAPREQAQTAALGFRVVFGNLKEQLGDVQSSWHLMGPLSQQFRGGHVGLEGNAAGAGCEKRGLFHSGHGGVAQWCIERGPASFSSSRKLAD